MGVQLPLPAPDPYLVYPFIFNIIQDSRPKSSDKAANRTMPLRYEYGTARILLVLNDLLDLGCFCSFASLCLSTV